MQKFLFTGFICGMNNAIAPKISFTGYVPKWKNYEKYNGLSFFSAIPIKNDTFGELTLGVTKIPPTCNDFKLVLMNRLKKVLGYEEIKINPEHKMISGKYIEVSPEYRAEGKRKGHKFGEILRLSSVMTMMENNLDSINIFSRGPAVFFHSKYKFEPDISDYFDRNKFLDAVIKDKSKGFEDLVEKAKIIRAKTHDFHSTSNESHKLTEQTNILAKEYIQRALKEEKPQISHLLYAGMDMKLTKETVLKEKDFFNALFEKHGIDYEIKER